MLTDKGRSPHTFHIPVMGTGFTVDTPLKVARYGISSVISLVNDQLLEQMREHHCRREGEPYRPIGRGEEDARARRVTAYLDLLHLLLERQVEALRSSPFEEGSEITRYFGLLPDCPLKSDYQAMLREEDPRARAELQEGLRRRVRPGSVDVNIMTKLDSPAFRGGEELPPEQSDAMAALRGFANSALDSSIVFSAGLNQRLYGYLAGFPNFVPDSEGRLRKKVVLKVSDYRSAEIQGRYLARKGLWTSEFRVESGVNCGGHVFANKGQLMGPILEEFRERKEELAEKLHPLYLRALESRGMEVPGGRPPMALTVQGGIGTAEEDGFLTRYYQVDGTGWGTPFLLVPEAVNVDREHLDKLLAAGEKDVFISHSSPLGVRFWNLSTSASEEARRQRIAQGKPGSACPDGHARLNQEFPGRALCTASRAYVKRKLEQLQASELPAGVLERTRERVLGRSCICHDLGGGVKRLLGMEPDATPAVCPGPNILNFRRTFSLEEMVSHIYGRLSLVGRSDRPHMFISELSIYVDYLREELDDFLRGLSDNKPGYFSEFFDNLRSGMDYYRTLAERFVEDRRRLFLEELATQREAVEQLFERFSAAAEAWGR